MVEAGLGLYPASTWYRRAYEGRVACVPLLLDVEDMKTVVMWRSPDLDAIASELAIRTKKVMSWLAEAERT